MNKFTYFLFLFILTYGWAKAQNTNTTIFEKSYLALPSDDIETDSLNSYNYSNAIVLPKEASTQSILLNNIIKNQSGEIYSNGPYYNESGTPNKSVLEAGSGLKSLGFNASFDTLGYSVAEDFRFTEDYEVDSILVYSYQTGASSSTSPFTSIYVQIWDGDPQAGGSVIWGDLQTNVIISSSWSGAYRASRNDINNTDRPIFEITANTNGLVLEAGKYWVEYRLSGTDASVPSWIPPIVIPGTLTTGSAIQYVDDDAAWAPILDSGTFTTQGIPFSIYGSLLPCPRVKWFAIDSVATNQASFSWLNDSTATNGYITSVYNKNDDPQTATPIIRDSLNPGASSYTSDPILQPDTSYDAYIVALCDSSEVSEYSMLTFKTLEFCESVSKFTATAVTDSTATLGWESNPQAVEGYKLILFHENEEPEIDTPLLQDSINSQADSYHIEGLQPKTTYDAYIYTLCSSKNHSEATYISFTTEESYMSVGDFLYEGPKLYPNPVQEYLTLKSSVLINKVNIYNMLGQKVLTKLGSENKFEVDLSSLKNGVYFIQMKASNGSITKKIIKN